MNISDHIESNPDIMLGKPVIKGTRITVELVLTRLSDGFDVAELMEMYPGLKELDVRACLLYAAQVLQNEEIIQAA